MNAALLVIDMQRGLFSDTPGPADASLVIDRINDLAQRARAAGAPVVWIQHENASGLRRGSAGWQLLPVLTVEAGDLSVRKKTPDSFLRTDLEALLAERDVHAVVICGYATEFCVDTTVRRAAALGYQVVIAADAHTTHDKLHATAAQIREHHNATLPEIASFGPHIEARQSAEIGFDAQV